MAPITLGFLTAPHLPHLTPDDRLALPYLAALGIQVRPVLWPDPRWETAHGREALLNGLSALVMRSCWGYHQDPVAFEHWLGILQELTQAGLPVWNTPSTFRQNMHKSYLCDVEEAGHGIVPTVMLTGAALLTTPRMALIERLGCDAERALVLKPAISASGEHTYLWKTDQSPAFFVAETPASQLWMVQPFVPSIATAGEYSLVFLGGQYSHCVRKLPAARQFLVHEEHGGLTQFCVPAPELLAAAQHLMQSPLKDTLLADDLYLRLDYVWYEQQWCLMEIERIEPSLYLAHDPQAPLRWAQHLHQNCLRFGLTLTGTHSL